MTVNTVANRGRPAHILLVEDNHGDVILTKRAFKEAKIANIVTVATTGEEALAILRKENEYSEAHLPDLILLDLNLPRISGQRVLEIIKNDTALKHIPVLMLTSSRSEQDVVSSYKLHATGYLNKPMSATSFDEVVGKLEQFWFTLVVMPEASDMKKIQQS